MWESILIMFLGKTILLTPAPITVPAGGSGVSIHLVEPISALTSGANIQIDVSGMAVDARSKADYRQSRKFVDSTFPVGSVEVTLEGDESNPATLSFHGASATRENMVRLILSRKNLETDIEYRRLTVRTTVELSGISIYWRNFTH